LSRRPSGSSPNAPGGNAARALRVDPCERCLPRLDAQLHHGVSARPLPHPCAGAERSSGGNPSSAPEHTSSTSSSRRITATCPDPRMRRHDRIKKHYHIDQVEMHPTGVVLKGPDARTWLTAHDQETSRGRPSRQPSSPGPPREGDAVPAAIRIGDPQCTTTGKR